MKNLLFGVFMVLSLNSIAQRIQIPCADAKSDSLFIRASSVGVSCDVNNAQFMAVQRAYARLVDNIVPNSYIEYAENIKIDSIKGFTLKAIKHDVVITCKTILFDNKSKSYESYVAVEISLFAVLNCLEKETKMPKELYSKSMKPFFYDREKFKAKFDEEMKKIENEN